MVAEPGSLLGACDVLLITATDRETTALKAALGAVSSAEPGVLHGRRKTYTDHGLVAGTRVVRVRCEMGAGAPGGASSTVADAIHEVAPRAIIMVGIAFGAKGKAKQRLGTILVSQQLQDYELQRVGTDPQGSQKIISRGDRVSASPRLVDRLRHAKESWSAKEPVEFGLVLSGDKLVDNVDFLAALKDHFPEAIGGEMEGRGLYVEAKDRAEWILVKAVCDWADGDKRKNKARNQKKAAEAAAGFVVHALLQRGFAGRQGPVGLDREIAGSGDHKDDPVRPRVDGVVGDDVPPADVLLAEAPPADVLLADVPPADVPPADVPPADVPPGDAPPPDKRPPPWVFISYSHELPQHSKAVETLSGRLRSEGIDAWIDRYVDSPDEGWPAWMRHQLINADYVLMICTETYLRRYQELPLARVEGDGPGKGVAWEARLAAQLIYDERSRNSRFIPVLLGTATVKDIPVELRSSTLYRLPQEYDELYARLSGQGAGPPPLGALRRRVVARLDAVHEGLPPLDRTDGPTMSPPRRGPPREGMRRLSEFLREHFSTAELRRFAFFHGGAEAADALPQEVDHATVAYELLIVLWRRGLVDDDLFAELRRYRPALAGDIDRIHAGFQGGRLARDVGSSASVEVMTLEPDGPRDEALAPATGPWSDEERAEVAALLEQALRGGPKLALALDDRLEARGCALSQPRPHDVTVRAARRILALGRGLAAAQALADDCCAVLGKAATAAHERRAARALIEAWLPRGYGGSGRIRILQLGPAGAAAPLGTNVSVDTLSPLITEVQVASLDRRSAQFSTRTVIIDGQRRKIIEGRARLPTRTTGSEVLTGEDTAEAIIRSVERRYTLEPRRTKARRIILAQKTIAAQAKHNDNLRHYVVFDGEERRQDNFVELAEHLNKHFKSALRIVVLADESDESDEDSSAHYDAEDELLTTLKFILSGPVEDDDDER